jgi:mono/diheme cytochrome c family protein
MRKFSLVVSVVFLCSCWHQQWEDRVASGDTGSVTYGDRKPDTSGNSLRGYSEFEGEALFRRNCAACHNASSKKSTGPGLMGVLDRIPGKKWAYAFVRNADSVIKSGDPYANKIYRENNKINHTKFPNLTNEEIDAILDFVNPAPDDYRFAN